MVTQCCRTFKNWAQKPSSIPQINQNLPRRSGTKRGLGTRGQKKQPLLHFQRVGETACFYSLSLNLKHPPPPQPHTHPRWPQNTGSAHPQALSTLVLLNRTNTLRSHHVSAHWHNPAVQKTLVCVCMRVCSAWKPKATTQHFTLSI